MQKSRKLGSWKCEKPQIEKAEGRKAVGLVRCWETGSN